MIFTSEMMHARMDGYHSGYHEGDGSRAGILFIRATIFKKSLRWIWSEVSFMYTVGLGV